MTENNAAHQNYLEAHRAVRGVLEANAVYFGGNTINSIVDAVLSKLRAEGVQAGDEREAVHNAAIKAAAKVCADIARQYDPQNNQENALASELYSAAAAILKLVKEDRDALASAPVAGEAPTDDEIIDMAVEPLGIDCDRMPHGVVVFARNLLSRYAVPQASEAVRDAMRNLIWAASERDKGNRIRQFDQFMDEARTAISPDAANQGSRDE